MLHALFRNRGVWEPLAVPRPAGSAPGHAWRADEKKSKSDAIGAGGRESYIHEYLNLRYGVRLELLDVLVEQQGPRAVLLVALEAWSGPYFHTELEERAPLVQRHARRGGRLEELEERVFVARSAANRNW